MGRHAILIANWTFDQLPELKTPPSDILAWKNLQLERSACGGFSTPIFVENEESPTVKDKLGQFLGSVHAADSDPFVIVYYTGHGCPNDTGGLVMATRDSRDDSPHRWLAFTDIEEALHRNAIKRALVMLDCCFSGIAGQTIQNFRGESITWSDTFQALTRELVKTGEFTDITTAVVNEAQSRKQKNPTFERKGNSACIYLLTATTASQVALGDKLEGRGIFTRHVTDCLSGNFNEDATQRGTRTPITVKQLFLHVYNRMLVSGQTPQLFVKPEGSEDLNVTDLDLIGINVRAKKTTTEWSGSVFSQIGPTYILDKSFQFADWNAAFEALIAIPLKLKRGSHVAEFLTKLDNWETDEDRGVKRRSTEDFRPGNVPTEHHELLEFNSPHVGLVVFDKLASQLRGSDGFWCVSLSPRFIQRPNTYWSYQTSVIKMEQLWSRYAESYDRIIGDYQGFRDLVDLVTERIPLDAAMILDVGAGTGASTIAAARLASNPSVDAIEMNGAMLQRLREKLINLDDLRGRIKVYYGDCLSVLAPVKDAAGRVCFPDGEYDACVMLNVLFALEDPEGVLLEINRVLKPGGALVLSTSRKTTDVSRLFDSIKASLEARGEFANCEVDYINARERNLEMNDKVTRHSVEEIEKLIVKTGFEIDNASRVNDAYDGCVVIFRAVKQQLGRVVSDDVATEA